MVDELHKQHAIQEKALEDLVYRFERSEQQLRELLTKEESRTNERIEEINIRFEYLNSWIGTFVAILSISLIVVSFGNYFSAGAKAEKKVNEWIKENKTQIQTKIKKDYENEMSKYMKYFDDNVQTIDNLQNEIEKSKIELARFREDLRKKADKAIARFENDFKLINRNSLSSADQKKLDNEVKMVLDKKEEIRTYDDWLDLGFFELASQNYKHAAESFDKAASILGVTDAEVARALVIKGFSLSKLTRKQEKEIKVYDEVVRRFSESKEALVLEQVAKALVSKGIAISKSGKFEDAIKVYEEVISRFSNSKDSVILVQVVRSMTNKGLALNKLGKRVLSEETLNKVKIDFIESNDLNILNQVARARSALSFNNIILAKTPQSGQEVRRDVFELLKESIAHATWAADRFSSDKKKIKALTYKGYALFLIDKTEDAENAIKHALRLGEKDIKEQVLENVRTSYSVPEDRNFRKFVKDIWSELQSNLMMSEY